MTGPRPGAALVVMPYWDFFEESTATDLRADREELLAAVTAVVAGAGATVLASRLITSLDDVAALAAELDLSAVDVVVVASSMAAPPTPVLRLIRQVPDAAVLIWPAAWPARSLEGFTHSDIVERGATVGTPMITSVLVKENRSFVVLPLDQGLAAAEDDLIDEIAAGAVAAGLRRSRIARVGDVLPGYEGLVVPDEQLATDLGVRVVRLDEAAFADAFGVVEDADVTDREAELRRGAVVDGDEESLRLATRSIVALERLSSAHTLSAGTLNCHCEAIRHSPSVAHAPCLALGESTSRGVPWTCTGDVLTAAAMLISSLLSGTSLYHEIEAFDPATNEFILANSGEHDSRWSQEPPRITANPWWTGSVCATHPVRTGPATLVALAQGPRGLRLVAAEGRVTADSEPTTGTSSARFAWGTTDPAAGWTSWVEAGAGHHSALGRGHLARSLGRVAHHLGIEFASTS